MLKGWGLGLLVIVLVAEHLVLTYAYRKRSSLSRLWAAGPSSRTDLVCWLAGLLEHGVLPFLHTVLSLLTLPGLVALALDALKDRLQWTGLLGWMHVDSLVAQVVIWLLVRDFLSYVVHWALHKSPALWRYHRLHHASTEFNIVTGNRVAWGERFINIVVLTLMVLALFGVPDPRVGFTVVLLIRLVDLLQHSDLPWDFGWLGYVVASPRFHRMHHSLHVEDHDTNFGNLFSFWDYLFGTVAPRYRQSSRVADGVELGIKQGEALNDWRRALVDGTFLERFAPGRPVSGSSPDGLEQSGQVQPADREPGPDRTAS